MLRKLDSCPGEKLINNMSAMQNSSTPARTCSTREPSWAEDFIDLSEFCQPSTIPIRMEDCADECITSPVNSAGEYFIIVFGEVILVTTNSVISILNHFEMGNVDFSFDKGV